MEKLDQRFLEVVLGSEGGNELWRAFYRKGRVLTLSRLPRRRNLPPLYRPQKNLAKVSYFALGWLERLGVAVGPWFETLAFSGSRDSLISTLEEETGGRILELLIGNPVQDQRRFLGLLEEKTGDLMVVKAGFTEAACEAIQTEADLLAEFGGKTPGVPRLTRFLGENGHSYRAFLLPLIEGGKVGESRALSHLQSWFQGGQQSLSSFSDWPQIKKHWKKAGISTDLLKEASQLRLEPVLEHGDYAPWNILLDHNEDLWALDWEAGQRVGIPALDWVHYLYQVDKLVAGTPFPRIIGNLDRRLQDADARDLLERAGWVGKHGWLVLVYLATNWLIPNDERPYLLRKAVEILFPASSEAS